MTNNITELVFILDKSGSMYGLESDTIGGFNSMLEKQKGKDGECYVTTVLFNQELTVVHDRVPVDKVEPMTKRDYLPSGSTALIDAMGHTIRHIDTIHKYARKEDVPRNTVFVIITDGMENSSSKYTSDDVKKTVERHKEKGWEFLFLGANIDAVETAKKYGISRDRAVNHISDKMGTMKNYETLGKVVENVRTKGKIGDDWASEIQKDYSARKTGK